MINGSTPGGLIFIALKTMPLLSYSRANLGTLVQSGLTHHYRCIDLELIEEEKASTIAARGTISGELLPLSVRVCAS